ncbi:hypothetical protein D3C75_984050 [compost metagenome]
MIRAAFQGNVLGVEFLEILLGLFNHPLHLVVGALLQLAHIDLDNILPEPLENGLRVADLGQRLKNIAALGQAGRVHTHLGYGIENTGQQPHQPLLHINLLHALGRHGLHKESELSHRLLPLSRP